CPDDWRACSRAASLLLFPCEVVSHGFADHVSDGRVLIDGEMLQPPVHLAGEGRGSRDEFPCFHLRLLHERYRSTLSVRYASRNLCAPILRSFPYPLLELAPEPAGGAGERATRRKVGDVFFDPRPRDAEKAGDPDVIQQNALALWIWRRWRPVLPTHRQCHE